jgi:hypothetical protein
LRRLGCDFVESLLAFFLLLEHSKNTKALSMFTVWAKKLFKATVDGGDKSLQHRAWWSNWP